MPLSETPSRRLATIVALDVAGYSARTEADEAKTTSEVAALRPIIEGIAARHGGRVFNTAGDGFMLEFGSSLAAVEAAFELAAQCEPKVRVGVHVGDVVVQPNGDLLGHGVNVAARLMAKSEPGATLISATARQTIRGPLADGLVSRGTLQLDKMSEAIEVFALAGDGAARRFTAAPAKSWTMWVIGASAAVVVLAALLGWVLWPSSGGAPDASVAVMPFENLSADKDNAFFASGIQDEILTRLTKIGSLKVISRSSTANLGSDPKNIAALARELGVATILEGSVQRSGDAVRVSLKLINAVNGAHVWAEHYDRKLDDIFSVQSEIAIAVADALKAKVTGREQQTLKRVPTTNPAAYDAYLRALALTDLALKGEPGVQQRIEDHLAEAVRLDPQFAIAWALSVRNNAWRYFTIEATEARRAAAQAALAKALRYGPDLEEVLLEQGRFQYWVEGDYDGARRHFELLRTRWPNNPQLLQALAGVTKRQGHLDEGKNYLRQAVELDPRSYDLRFDEIALHFATRDFAGATRLIDAALNLWPDDGSLLAQKIAVLQVQGRLDEAEVLLKTVRPAVDDGTLDVVTVQAVYRRKYGDAIRAIKALTAGSSNFSTTYFDMSLGYLLDLSGDAAGAKASYVKARDGLLAELKLQANSTRVLTGLAFVQAGLNERDSALAYAARAVELAPVTKDVMIGASNEDVQMRVWARFGDRDRAIGAIERLLKLPAPFPLTPVALRLDPDFDKLRGDARFEALAGSSD